MVLAMLWLSSLLSLSQAVKDLRGVLRRERKRKEGLSY